MLWKGLKIQEKYQIQTVTIPSKWGFQRLPCPVLMAGGGCAALRGSLWRGGCRNGQENSRAEAPVGRWLRWATPGHQVGVCTLEMMPGKGVPPLQPSSPNPVSPWASRQMGPDCGTFDSLPTSKRQHCQPRSQKTAKIKTDRRSRGALRAACSGVADGCWGRKGHSWESAHLCRESGVQISYVLMLVFWLWCCTLSRQEDHIWGCCMGKACSLDTICLKSATFPFLAALGSWPLSTICANFL